jgi:hypothetical protein
VSEADALAGDWPGWHIWRSQAGRWWAIRAGPVTVDADTPEQLAEALASQPAAASAAPGLS